MSRTAVLVLGLVVVRSAMAGQVPLAIRDPGGGGGAGWPITTGVPFPAGVLPSVREARLLDSEGVERPSQAVCTGVHQDGSVRWLLLDFQARASADREGVVLDYGPGVTRRPVLSPLRIEDGIDAVDVDTGRIAFSVHKRRFNGLATAALGNSVIIEAGHGGGPYFIDSRGEESIGCFDSEPDVCIESRGPLRTVITARGWYVNRQGERKCRFTVRIHALAGKPYIRLFYTWLMTEDSRLLRFRDIGFRVPARVSACMLPLDDGTRLAFPVGETDSVGLVQYDYGRFRLHTGEDRSGGSQPLGVIAASGPGGATALAVRDFGQLFPKELGCTPVSVPFTRWIPSGSLSTSAPSSARSRRSVACRHRRAITACGTTATRTPRGTFPKSRRLLHSWDPAPLRPRPGMRQYIAEEQALVPHPQPSLLPVSAL